MKNFSILLAGLWDFLSALHNHCTADMLKIIVNIVCFLSIFTIRKRQGNVYHQHAEYGEGNVFTGVCLFTGGSAFWGVCLSTMPWENRPPMQTPPPGRPPRQGYYGIRSTNGHKHPTGMHPCFTSVCLFCLQGRFCFPSVHHRSQASRGVCMSGGGGGLVRPSCRYVGYYGIWSTSGR